MTTTDAIDLVAFLDDDHRRVVEAIPSREVDTTALLETAREMREMAAARLAAAPPVLPKDIEVEDHHVPGLGGAPEVRVRTYRKRGAATPAPAFYWIHGGGMISGSVEGNDIYCAGIAHDLGAVVASVEYRLAPEHPYPAPLEDCYAGLQWFAASAYALGLDPARIAIGGGSAGAGLAAGLALMARDRGEIAICYQHLVYPMVDDRNQTASSYRIQDGRVWNRNLNTVGWNAYLGGRAGQDDVEVYAAPARATDLSGLPPAYICVGTLDLFLDEDIAYARALLAAGVPAELHVYPGAFHGSMNMVPHAALSQRWRADELAAIRRALLG